MKCVTSLNTATGHTHHQVDLKMACEGKILKFEKENLGRYFRMCLRGLSYHYTGMDTSRLTGVSRLLYFEKEFH
jgi:hypothetical protein